LRWICGVKPKPKAVNKPSHHCIMHGLDKPGVFTTVSILTHVFNPAKTMGCRRHNSRSKDDSIIVKSFCNHRVSPTGIVLKSLYFRIIPDET